MRYLATHSGSVYLGSSSPSPFPRVLFLTFSGAGSWQDLLCLSFHFPVLRFGSFRFVTLRFVSLPFVLFCLPILSNYAKHPQKLGGQRTYLTSCRWRLTVFKYALMNEIIMHTKLFSLLQLQLQFQLMHIQFTSSAPRCFADTLHTNLNMELYFRKFCGAGTIS